MAQITYTIQAKRDTAANWTANNPTLAEGEFGFETDTKKLKIGDGNTLWASLPYKILTDDIIGVANGVAPLNASGTIDPEYVDAVAKGHQQGATSTFGATTTVYVEQTVSTNSQYQHFIAETSLADAIPSTNLEPDSVILIRFFRDSAHANDTFPDAVMGMFGDIHYQTSTISTLNKTPNFYA